ncbi:MAG: hypothetical protein ABII64_00825 [Elusimicrobiota bacterium]
MKKLIGLMVLMAMIVGIGSYAQAADVWTADFTPEGVSHWMTYGADATKYSDGTQLIIESSTNSWDAGGIYPDKDFYTRVPISSLTNGHLNYNCTNVTADATFDISLDEFDTNGNYVGTIWNVVANPAPLGSRSVSLSALTYDAGAVSVMPKINFHTTATGQGMTMASLTFDDGEGTGGNTADVTVTVVNAEVSVEVTGTVAFGTIVAGQTAVSANAITVTNSGTGNATFKLQLTNPADWTASTVTGVNQYVLNGAFSSVVGGITWSEANHNLTTTSVTCTDTIFAGDQTGFSVAASANRSLWLQFKAPTVVSSEAAHTIVVTVTAVAQP